MMRHSTKDVHWTLVLVLVGIASAPPVGNAAKLCSLRQRISPNGTVSVPAKPLSVHGIVNQEYVPARRLGGGSATPLMSLNTGAAYGKSVSNTIV